MQRLSELDFVFFTEHYTDIVNTVGSVFGLKEPQAPPVLNRSENPGVKELTQELQDHIESANQDDAELYAVMAASLAA